MANSRSKNTPGNYAQEKWEKQMLSNYRMFENNAGAAAYTKHLAGLGFYGGPRMANFELSENSVDIESALRGLNTGNLESPQAEVQPVPKNLLTMNLYEAPTVFIPRPGIIPSGQRPEYAWGGVVGSTPFVESFISGQR
jgi:hypothetical protein